MRQVSVIIAAAGNSTRFAGNDKKTFVELAGLPVWLHSANIFSSCPDVSQIIVAVSPEDRDRFQDQFGDDIARLEIQIASGGRQRSDTVANALAMVSPSSELIAIHDGARPCFTRELFELVVGAARAGGAAIPAIPIASTVKRVGLDSVIQATVDRNGLYLAQTPQVFQRQIILDAYRNRGTFQPTDEANLLEHLGESVSIVNGSKFNIKITQPEDLHFAESCLAAIR